MLSNQELFRTIITHMERIDMSIFEIGSLGMSGELAGDPELSSIVQEFLQYLNEKSETFHNKIMNHAVKTGILPKNFEVPTKGSA